MKSCSLCREKINITANLCRDCKTIKSFINLYGKDRLLHIIKMNGRVEYTFKPPSNQPSAPNPLNSYYSHA